MLAGWNKVDVQPPDQFELKDRGYLPNVVFVWSQHRREFRRWSLAVELWELVAEGGWTHWLGVPVPPKDVATEPTPQPCTCAPPVINITFGDVHIANEADADEFQARVVEAVRKALGREDKGQPCETCRHYSLECDYCVPGRGSERPGCYEARPSKCGGA